MKPNHWLRRAVGLLFMVVGGGGVVVTMVALNQSALSKNARDTVQTVAFEVPKQKEPPKARPQPKPKPKPQKRSNAPKAPALGASLAGLSFGLPGFDSNLADLTDSMIGDVGDVVMTEDAVDVVPRATSRPTLDYPARARANHIEGYVSFSLLIGADGTVQDTRILDAQPPGVFDQSALAAVRELTFEPAYYQGRPVSVRVRQTLRFDLQ